VTATVEIVEADLAREDHQRIVTQLLDAYARDPMGNGKPLDPDVRDALIPGLRQLPTTMIFLAYAGEEPVGIAICFLGFSTFAARRLVNIHDLAVLPDHRGAGVGRALIAGVERKARELDCCKLTLEVQENNHRAQRTYAAAGFVRTTYVDEAGGALFLSKRL
jgi:ribosomal protein S18 acetylase RimI-like enzyme